MVSMTSEVFDTLKSKVRGAVLAPSDAGYDEARTVWNATIDKRPAVIVRCAGSADVIAAVNFARDNGEAAARLTSTRGLDGGVERQQIGLSCDRVDQLDHFADFLGAGGERLNGGIGALGIADRPARDLARARHLTRNLGNRA